MADSLEQIVKKVQKGAPLISSDQFQVGDVATFDGRSLAPSAIIPQRIAKATYSSNVTITASTAATATSILALPATAYNGGLVRIDFRAAQLNFTPSAAANYAAFTLWDNDAPADLGIVATVSGVVAGVVQIVPLSCVFELTPSAATHTYSVRGYKSAAAATALVVAAAGGAGTQVPMQITANYV